MSKINPDKIHRSDFHAPTERRPLLSFWCGREGWLTGHELCERTLRDIEAYAKRQPFRFRQAMKGMPPGPLAFFHRPNPRPVQHNDHQKETQPAC